MNLKILFKKKYHIFFDFAKKHYPEILLIVFFLIKTNVFNYWTNVPLIFPITRNISAIGFILMLLSPLAFIKKKWFYLILISFLTSIIFAGNFVYYSYTQGFLSISALRYAGQLGSVTDFIIKLIDIKTLVFFLDVIVLILLYLLLGRKNKQITKNTLKKRFLFFSLIFIVSISCISYVFIRDKHFSKFIFFPYENSVIIEKTGISNYMALDGIKYFLAKKTATEKEINFIKNWSENRKAIKQEKYKGVAKNKNIIFVQLEAFEEFLVDFSIDNQEITPNLNKFAEDNYRLSNFYYQTCQGMTSDAEFAVINSLFPLINSSPYFDYVNNDYNSLIKQLNEIGYSTNIMHGWDKHFWNRDTAYKAYKLDNFFSKNDFIMGEKVGWGLSDKDFFDQSTEKIKNLKKPHFSMLITLSSHGPFTIDDKNKNLKIEDGRFDNLITDYLQIANYTDAAFGDFIDKLKRNDIYNDSIIIVYGDHRAGINQYLNEDFKNIIKRNDGLDETLHERVPFIIHVPGQEIKGHNKKPSDLLDIYPTVMNLIGKNIPKTTLGKDIFNPSKNLVPIRRHNYLNGSFINDEIFYLFSEDKIFENGICYNWKVNKKIETAKCKSGLRKAKDILDINDIIIRTNNLKLLE